jgi:hypothetical protein
VFAHAIYAARFGLGFAEACLPKSSCAFLFFLFAHYLRVPLSNPKASSLAVTANSNDFASDFFYADERGPAYQDDPRKLVNWYGYGKPVYASCAGVILAMAHDTPDNWFEDVKAAKFGHRKLPAGKDPKGNR